MDIISFNEASTANGRIENFIENPDSTSGVLTVPKTIAAGETITIPAGRVAILPDLQVDGDLVVDGDLFIPTGSMTSQVVQKVTSTDNAIVRFNGTTGDVQNSGVIIDDSNNVGIGTNAPSVRLDINSTTNTAARLTAPTGSYCAFSLLPNGSGSGLSLGAWADSSVSIYNQLNSYMTFGTNNLERMRIDSAGNVGIGVTPSAWNNGANVKVLDTVAGSLDSVGYTLLGVTQNAYYNSAGNWIYKNNGQATRYAQGGIHSWYTTPSGTAGNAITWTTAMTLNNNGNLLLGTSTDDGVNKLQVNGDSTTAGKQTALQFKRYSNSPPGMTGFFGDKIEYAIRRTTSSTSKTFRVTNSSPGNNENFGLFFKARWVIYDQNPSMGSYEYCVGFKQPGSGAACVFVHAASGNAIGSTSPLSVSSTAINSYSFDVTITVNNNYTNVSLELEAMHTSCTCTITPL